MNKRDALRDRYRTLIENGAYAPGDRVPSIRDLARSSGVSVNTARAAYELLERDGLVRARERGGYFVRSRRRFAAYEPPSGNYPTSYLSTSGKIDYIHDRGSSGPFALAAPGEDLIPSAAIARILASGGVRDLRYPPPSGDEELRARIAARRAPFHREIGPEDIIITNGATEAVAVTLRTLLSSGDVVAIESPSYFDFSPQIVAAGGVPVEIPLIPGVGMDPDALDRECRCRPLRMAIVQPRVQNPTGIIASKDALKRFAEVASKHGIAVVQDDVYADLAFSGEDPIAIDLLADLKEFIYISSFSKVLAPGLRVGWLATKTSYDALMRSKRLASCAVSGPAQRVIASYLSGRAFDRHLARSRMVLAERLAAYLEPLREHLPSGCSIVPPAGGCLLWIGLPRGADASLLFERCAAEGIVIAPGELFSANPHFRGHFRLNYGSPLDEVRKAELRRICELCGR